MQRIVLSTIVASILLMPCLATANESASDEKVVLSPVELSGYSSIHSNENKEYYKTKSESATRTDTPLRETAQSVQTVSREVLDDLGAVKLDDTLDYVSGVSRQNNFGGTWDNFAIRGFAGHENTGMSLLKNGFADNRGFNAPRDAANIETIEFLKGPSGALYGNSEPGGTINIVTKKPKFTTSNAIDTYIGTDNFYRIATDSTGALSDVVAYRLNLAHEQKDSFRDHVDSKRQVIAPSLIWILSDDTALSYDGEYIKQKAPLDRGIVAINENVKAVDYETFFGNPNDGDVTLKNFTHQLKLEHDFLNGWSGKAGLAYKTGSLEGTASEVKPFANLTTDSVLLRTRYRDYDSKDISFQGDIKNVSYIGDVKNTLLLGMETYKYELDSIMYNLNNSVRVDNFLSKPTYTVLQTGKGTLITDRYEQQKGISLFGQDEVAFGDWRLLGGIRYDEVEMYTLNHLNNTSSTQKDYVLSPRIGITYLIDPSWSVYATSGKSFRPNSGVDVNGNSFKAEEGLSYETGMKVESLDKRVGATLSLFQIDKENVVSSDPSGTYSIATGEVRSKGIEFDISGKVTDNLKVSANYAYTNAKVTKDKGGVTDWATSTVVNLEGKELLNIPKHSAGLLVMWEDSLMSYGSYGLGSGINYVGTRQGNYINSFTLPSYTTVKLLSYWKVDNNLTFKFNIENLFDKEYIASSYDRSWLTPGSPRSAMLSMHYKF